MSFQQTEIIGVIGKDAVTKMIGTKEYITFSVAVSNGKDAQGNQRESTWFEVIAPFHPDTQGWLLDRLKAKTNVFVIGRATVSAYINKENKAVGSISIWANRIDPLGGTSQEGGNTNNGNVHTRPQDNSVHQPHYAPQPQSQTYQEDESNLPF